MVDLESLGVPGVFLASDVFQDGAEKQAAALGAVAASVYVPHPIQDRTDQEIEALADKAFDRIVERLIGG